MICSTHTHQVCCGAQANGARPILFAHAIMKDPLSHPCWQMEVIKFLREEISTSQVSTHLL